MLKALSLLELIIVMSITATLMGIGIVALIQYRASVQLETAYTDTVSAIKLLQNKANNSSSVTSGSTRIAPDIYALNFDNNVLTPYYCVISGGAGTLVHCDLYPSSTITSFQQVYNVNVTSNCAGAGFTRLSGDVVSINENAFRSNAGFNSTGACTLTLTQQDTFDTRVITFDLTLNKVDLQ